MAPLKELPPQASYTSAEELRGALADGAPLETVTLTGLRQASELEECLGLLAEPGTWTLNGLHLVSCSLQASSVSALGAVLRRHGGWEVTDTNDASCEEAGVSELLDFEGDLFSQLEEEGTADDGQNRLSAADGGNDEGNEWEPPPGLKFLHIVESRGLPTDAWSPLWRDLPSSLQELDLSCNGLNDHALHALCGAFQGRHCPESIGLSGNRCKDIERLCILAEGGGLRKLDLTDNFLNDKSIASLCGALSSSRCRLNCLRLSKNTRITVAGHKQLVRQLPRGSLRFLALDQTSFCDETAALLIELLPECTLDELRLEATKVSDTNARQLLSALRSSPRVACVCLDEGGQRVRWRRSLCPADLLQFALPMSWDRFARW